MQYFVLFTNDKHSKYNSDMNIKFLNTQILSEGWSTLKHYTYEFTRPDGKKEIHERESYDRGNGVTALLYNPDTQKVVLTRQFRLPTHLNGNPGGMMIEACAGKLESDEDPEIGMIREIEEETGFVVKKLDKIFEAYMSPGTVTELIHFYLADYSDLDRKHSGGGNAEEYENIEVLEISLSEAKEWIANGQIKDGKTIMLLQHIAMRKKL